MEAVKTMGDLLDQIAAHLAKQRSQATDDEGRCRYRSPHGQACAVGCLISDKAYDRAIEGFGPSYLMSADDPHMEAARRELLAEKPHGVGRLEFITFLQKVQEYHDGGAGKVDYIQRLSETQTEAGLLGVLREDLIEIWESIPSSTPTP